MENGQLYTTSLKMTVLHQSRTVATVLLSNTSVFGEIFMPILH